MVLTRECKLLVLLCKFITTEELKRVACECLLVILSRKVNEIISNHGNHMVSRELVTEIYFVHDAILRGMQTVP